MQPIKNFRNPARVKTHLAPEVTSENLESYRKALQPKSQRKSAIPLTGYEGIKEIDWDKGLTHWKDGRVERWSTDAQRPEFDEEEETPYWVKWRARVNVYWSTHTYQCQVCGLGRKGEMEYTDDDDETFSTVHLRAQQLQRPNNHNEGPVTVRRLDGLPGFGDERDDDLAALCTPCLDETRQVAEDTGEDWERVVTRWTSRHNRGEARRKRTLSLQAHERKHKRARKQEWRAEMDRRKEAGETLDREFLDEYRDVYESLSTRRPRA